MWVVPVAIAFVLATVAIIPQTTGWLTTYSGSSPASAFLDLAAGAGLLVAGVALLLRSARATMGWLAVLAGTAWLASDWIGWQGGVPLARTLATGVSLFFLPLVLHLVVLQRRPRAGWTAHRFVVPAYAAAGVLGVALLLFRDPRIDLYCWSNCADDVLLAGNVPWLVNLLRYAVPSFELAVAAGIVATSVFILVEGTQARRQASAGVLIPAIAVGFSEASHGFALLVDPHEGPRFALHVVLFQLRALSVALLAAGLAWTVVRAWRDRLAVMRLAAALGDAPQPGALAEAIALKAHDPSLEFVYWLAHRDRFVDASGQPAQLPHVNSGRSALRVTLGGRLIGLALHNPGAITSADLDRLMGPAARLAMENERLQAELQVKVTEVRASRARIVSARDAARERMERDLHDGAQQAFLAFLHELQAAALAADATGDTVALGELRRQVEETATLLSELREIAHGIYPAVLADSGLAVALRTLADTAPIPLAVGDLPAGRLPVMAERTGYAVVASAVDAAASSGTEELALRGHRDDERLILELQGLGPEEVPEITDRLSAADGGWSREGDVLQVWIPCA